MFPPFDIFRVESDGHLLWQGTAETLALARLRVKILSVSKDSDYVIYSQQTGHKTVVRKGESDNVQPICPEHQTFMVSHSFQPWELSVAKGTLEGFRCPTLSCPIVYIETLEGFHTLDAGKLTRLPPAEGAR